MPSFYTHYNFGKKVIPKLSPKIQNIIKQNEELFVFGNQGPDLFFFDFLSAVRGKNPGGEIHSLPFIEIVKKARYNLLKLGVHSNANVYFLGLCCHFLLDSTAHPTVNALSTDDYTHFDIESELDRFFIEKNNEDALKLKQYELIPSPDIAEYIYPVYAGFPEVSKELIYSGIKDMRRIKKFFQPKGNAKENFIIGIEKLIRMKEFSGLLIMQQPFEEAAHSNELLEKLYYEALDRAPVFLDEVYAYVFESDDAPAEFRKDFNGV